MADGAKFDIISKLDDNADYLANNLTEWEHKSIERIARKIGKIGKMSKSEAAALDVDEESKKEWAYIVAALSVATASNIRSLKKAYSNELDDWHNNSQYMYNYRGEKFIKAAENDKLQAIVEQYAKQNAEDIVNLTQTKALSVYWKDPAKPLHFQDAIYKAFGDAVKTVTEGNGDFYSSMRTAIKNLSGGGVRVDYGNGITRRLDTVVRQNMLWGIKQSHKEYNELVGREIGSDGIEIDYHTNSRPSHRYMQGKQYAKGAAGKTVNGVFYPSAEKEGVYARLYEDYGCRHYEKDIILGVSVPRYTDEELKRFEEQDRKIYKIGGIEKDGYGWSQVMRNLETEIRKSKDQINALKAFGNSQDEIKALKAYIKKCRSKYDEIVSVTGISADKKRMSVPRK